MKNLLLTILLILCPTLVLAQQINQDGILFTVQDITYGQWFNPYHTTQDSLVEKKKDKKELLDYIALKFLLTNTNSERKIDVTGDLSYGLSDEFDNSYRQIKRPKTYKDPVLFLSKNFPSIYPQESYGEIIFFETPVAKSQKLTLKVAGEPFGINQNITINIPLKVNPISEITQAVVAKALQGEQPVADLSQETQPITKVLTPTQFPQDHEIISPLRKWAPKVSVPGTIKIEAPVSGVVLQQGDLAYLNVTVTSGSTPYRIIISGIGATYEDAFSEIKNTYDINVPFDQEPGRYTLNVIASWKKGDDYVISSDAITVYVKDYLPLDIL